MSVLTILWAIFLFCSVDGLIKGPRTLVLLENQHQVYSFSILFSKLSQHNFEFTFRIADDSSLTLSLYGEYLYENLIIMAPTTEEFGGDLSRLSIIDFIDSGRNLFLCLDSRVSTLMRDISLKCGVNIDEANILVSDHFSSFHLDYSPASLLIPNSKLIFSKNFVGNSYKSFSDSFLIYTGIGLRLNESNPLLFKILSGFTTTYTNFPHEPIHFYPHLVGSETVLVSALQTRNQGRVVISGSLDFFSNKIFKQAARTQISNKNISLNLVLWCFKHQGLLRIVSISHHKFNDTTSILYTVNDDVSYYIKIEELIDNSWRSYDASDVQIEIRRIDPYIRLNMTLTEKLIHQVNFSLPDVYGVFQFIINYSRIGFNTLYSSSQVSVRPFQHTEYERFIFCAFPYYCSSFSMLLGFITFSIIFLNHLTLSKYKVY